VAGAELLLAGLPAAPSPSRLPRPGVPVQTTVSPALGCLSTAQLHQHSLLPRAKARLWYWALYGEKSIRTYESEVRKKKNCKQLSKEEKWKYLHLFLSCV